MYLGTKTGGILWRSAPLIYITVMVSRHSSIKPHLDWDNVSQYKSHISLTRSEAHESYIWVQTLLQKHSLYDMYPMNTKLDKRMSHVSSNQTLVTVAQCLSQLILLVFDGVNQDKTFNCLSYSVKFHKGVKSSGKCCLQVTVQYHWGERIL